MRLREEALQPTFTDPLVLTSIAIRLLPSFEERSVGISERTPRDVPKIHEETPVVGVGVVVKNRMSLEMHRATQSFE